MVLLQTMREMGDLIRVKMKRDTTLKLSSQEYEGKALTGEEVEKLYEASKAAEPAEGEKKDLKATPSEMILPAIALAVNASLRDCEIRTLIWERTNWLKAA
jgi:hypothetical protein